ncbi:TIGR03936 family radical SAM-associated protein [Clostridium sp. JNZ X4-2]
MREQYLIKFSKGENIKFIGHLDLMRAVQRMIKRSKIPAEYSKGFNPHINMSIAQPLSVGVYSCGEYMDLYLEQKVSEEEIMDKLNVSAPEGIRVLKVNKVRNAENRKVFKSMAEISAAEYLISMKYNDTGKLKENMNDLMKMDHWYDLKKTKRGECEVDIKRLVKNMEYTVHDDKLVLNILISSGSVENLSPRLLVHFIQDKTENADKEDFVDIMRKEMYGKIKGKLIPLNEYVNYI